ncbi:MAG: hypothetical protein HFACDABA_01625 [Anaerolineales bacterium]|nr:hypothetical protein [Anaerolineales bacterium]
MSAEERQRILKMVEEGRISAEQALTLFRALEENVEPALEVYQPESASGGEGSGFASGPVDAPEFEEVKARARQFAMIPLWIGVALTVLFAGLMYWALATSGFGFWFYCLTFPFLLCVFVVALAAGGMNSRWLFVDVQQKPGETPGRITLGFPVPLGLVAWILRNFGHHIRGLGSPENAQAIASMLNRTITSDAPLIVNVDDDDGEKVRVYIG